MKRVDTNAFGSGICLKENTRLTNGVSRTNKVNLS
jgi:hypothetical protein